MVIYYGLIEGGPQIGPQNVRAALNQPSKYAGRPRAALKNIRAALESLIRPRFFADLYTPKYSDAFTSKNIMGAPFISKYSIIGLYQGVNPPISI